MSVDIHKHHATLKQILIKEDIEEDEFSPGIIDYDWEYGVSQSPVTQGEHESFVRGFLQSDAGTTKFDGGNFLILKGGIGTGKSTTINRLFNEYVGTPRYCSLSNNVKGRELCIHPPTVLRFDFGDWRDVESGAGKKYKNQKQRFWREIGSIINPFIIDQMQVKSEVTEFWLWYLKQSKALTKTHNISNYLNSYLDEIKKLTELIEEDADLEVDKEPLFETLSSVRKQIYTSLSPKEKAWYFVYQLLYIREEQPNNCHCIFIVFDNIDQLHPKLQVLAVNTAQSLNTIYNARTIIAVRPLTYQHTIHGYYLTHIERHKSPDISDVINKRVSSYISQYPDSFTPYEEEALKQCINKITSGRRYNSLATMFHSTCGYSVRFSLRNITNFMSSPIFKKISEKPNDPFSGHKRSDIYEAYFLDETGRFRQQAFEDLYMLNGSNNPKAFLIKSRILYLLTNAPQKSQVQMRWLVDILQWFGYNNNDIKIAINNLLQRSRPLVWCEDGFEISKLKSKGRITLTPVGWGYYNNIFGDIWYDYIHLTQTSISKGSLSIERLCEYVYDFHRELTNVDFVEVKTFVGNTNMSLYADLYNQENPSMSYIHGKRIVGAINGILKGRKTSFFDPNRLDYLRKRIIEEIPPLNR